MDWFSGTLRVVNSDYWYYWNVTLRLCEVFSLISTKEPSKVGVCRFFVLTNKEPDLGFSYWLEGGSVQHFGTSAGRANPIYLRDNKQLRLNDREPLEPWEPMTPSKMGLIALQLHVVGDARTARGHRLNLSWWR